MARFVNDQAVLRRGRGPFRPFGGGFDMTQLFGSTAGIYHNFSDLTSLYTDSAGATPLTLPDTTIGLVADRSRVRSPVTVAAGIQANAGLRPKWGRAPKVRRQLFTYTEQFDNAVWTKLACTVTANAVAAPDGATTADKLIEAATTAIHGITQSVSYTSGVQYTMSCYMKKGVGATAPDWMQVTFNATAFGSSQYANFNLNTGAVGTVVGGSATIADAGGGWYRVTFTASATSTTSGASSVAFTNNSNAAGRVPSYAGATTSDVFLWGAQIEAGSTVTAYQKAETSFDVTETGVSLFGFTRPDRSDDVLSTTIPADQTGDVAIFGRTGSWIENAKTYAAASTFSLGAATATGLASGVLAAVGDIVGVLAIGKALSAAEKQSALDYHKARGAAGWLTAGAELISNGDFASGTTGWTATSSTLLAPSGELIVTATSTSQPSAAQAVAVTAGNWYRATVTFRADAANVVAKSARFRIGSVSSGGTIYAGPFEVTANGVSRTVDVVFQATLATCHMMLEVGSTAAYGAIGDKAYFDNVSVKPLTVAA